MRGASPINLLYGTVRLLRGEVGRACPQTHREKQEREEQEGGVEGVEDLKII